MSEGIGFRDAGAMSVISPPSHPPTDPSSPSAVELGVRATRWLAALGAVLLTAAGLTLLTARWDELHAYARFAILLAGTGAVGALAHRMRLVAPTTARVLGLLTMVLIPLDAAALALWTTRDWRVAVLTAGAVGVAASIGGQRMIGGPVPLAARVAAITAVAVGTGALAALPTAALLGLAAIGAWAGREYIAAVGLAALAVVAPLWMFVPDGPWFGQLVVTDGGLLGEWAAVGSIVGAVLAAVVLALAAQRSRNRIFVGAALLALLIGGLNAWIQIQPPATYAFAAGATVLLGLQAGGALSRRDPLFGEPLRIAADTAELTIGLLLTIALTVGAIERWILQIGGAPDLVAAAALSAIAWTVGGLRRERQLPAMLAVWSGITGVVLVDAGVIADSVSIAALLVAGLGLAATFIDRPGYAIGGLVSLCIAPLLALDPILTAEGAAAASANLSVGKAGLSPSVVAFAISLVATGAVSIAAAWRRAQSIAGEAFGPRSLAVLAVLPLVIGGSGLLTTRPVVGLAGIALGLLVAAVLTDSSQPDIGQVHRILAIASCGGAIAFTSGTWFWFCLAGTAVGLVEARRLRDMLVGQSAAAIGAIAVLAGLLAAGTESAVIAYLLLGTVGTAVVAFVAAGVRHPMVDSFAVAAAVSAAGVALGERPAFAISLLVIGGFGMLIGRTVGRPVVSWPSLALATVGWWTMLVDLEVGAAELYLLPLALSYFAALGTADVRGLLRCVAPVLMLAVVALGEYVVTADARHLVFIGILGVLSAWWGATRGELATQLVGIALAVAVASHQVLDATVGLAAWGFLAIGGATMLTVALFAERRAPRLTR